MINCHGGMGVTLTLTERSHSDEIEWRTGCVVLVVKRWKFSKLSSTKRGSRVIGSWWWSSGSRLSGVFAPDLRVECRRPTGVGKVSMWGAKLLNFWHSLATSGGDSAATIFHCRNPQNWPKEQQWCTDGRREGESVGCSKRKWFCSNWWEG